MLLWIVDMSNNRVYPTTLSGHKSLAFARFRITFLPMFFAKLGDGLCEIVCLANSISFIWCIPPGINPEHTWCKPE